MLLALMVCARLAHSMLDTLSRLLRALGAPRAARRLEHYSDAMLVYYELLRLAYRRSNIEHYIPSVG